MPSSHLRRRRRSRLNLTNRKVVIASVVAVLLFVGALTLWAGGGSDDTPEALASPNPSIGSPGSASIAPSPTASSPSPSPSPSPTASGSAASQPGALVLPDLPESTNIRPGDLPRHSTTIKVTSDSPILQFGYKTAYGSSSKKNRYFSASPAVVTTATRGYGAQAVVGAQSGPFATYVTCSISVDGQTRITKTVKGSYHIVVCIG